MHTTIQESPPTKPSSRQGTGLPDPIITSTVVDMSSTPGPQTDGPEVFLVLDAVDVEVVAAFWAEAMHYRRVDRLNQYVVLVPMEGASGSVFLVQGVDEPKSVKNRMHLDLHVTDPEAEADRLVALGAQRVGAGSLGEISWICMTDPEGNEFDIGRR